MYQEVFLILLSLFISIIRVTVGALYYVCYAIFWCLLKSRLLYPIIWFVFSLVVASHTEWTLYNILINSWTAWIWLAFGIILAAIVVILGIRDIINIISDIFH